MPHTIWNRILGPLRVKVHNRMIRSRTRRDVSCRSPLCNTRRCAFAIYDEFLDRRRSYYKKTVKAGKPFQNEGGTYRTTQAAR